MVTLRDVSVDDCQGRLLDSLGGDRAPFPNGNSQAHLSMASRTSVKRAIVDRTRQNHALEHATIAILLQGGSRTPLAGNATPGGFFVYGKISTEEVQVAVSEALHRLQAGERELAVSPYCGTNLVVGALVAGLLTGLIAGTSRRRLGRVPLMATAILGAAWLGRPLGSLVQRRYTTLPDVEDLVVTGIRGVRLGGYTAHRVRTASTQGQ